MKDNKYITEANGGGSFIKDALNNAVGVNVDEVKNAKEASDKFVAVANQVNSAGKNISELDRMVSTQLVDNRSIFARARNSIMQFPCYVSQTIPINAAQILTKTFERVYANFVQSAISQQKIIDENEANDLLFLRKFHTNITESADVLFNGFYEPIDELDAIMKEAVFHREQITPTMFVEFSYVPASASEYLVKECARLTHDPLEGFTYLQEASGDKKVNGFFANKAEKRKAEEHDRNYEDHETTSRRRHYLSADEITQIEKNNGITPTGDNHDQLLSMIRKAHEKGAKPNSPFRNLKIDESDGIYRIDTTVTSDKRMKEAIPVSVGPDAPVLLKDNEIKKLNQMAPYLIACHFQIRSKNGDLNTAAHYVIGVKTILHIIRPQDLAEDLREMITGKMKSIQKVRYKSGEISWWEYLFHKNQLKKDASKVINYNKRWINTLKRLSEFDKTKGSLMKGPVSALNKGAIPIPNATLILSQPDVTMLTNQTGIDLSKVTNAAMLAKSLYLLSVVIVDASAGTVRILAPDSMNDWDVQSLASLDAEVAKTDNSQLMRELNHLVNK